MACEGARSHCAPTPALQPSPNTKYATASSRCAVRSTGTHLTLQQCCDYIDTFFAIQKHAMRDEKINKLQCGPVLARLLRSHIRWGALGRPSNTQRIKLPSPRVQNLRERQSAGNAQQTRTPRAPRAQRNAQLAEQLEQQLVDLSRSYLWILFNFGDFAKPIEDLVFFVSVHRLIGVVVRKMYGVTAQKRAEVEFGRIFHSSHFNNAEHKYREDPDVKAYKKYANVNDRSHSSTINSIRTVSRNHSELLFRVMPTKRPTDHKGAMTHRPPSTPQNHNSETGPKSARLHHATMVAETPAIALLNGTHPALMP
eukprot:TRINITY_DN2644_c0_g1_i4.p1 TRINITY_DN2644_c0_g1~~TRINITY_DN2644_c0_g1_i4.p1  ORF type:complete len:311 (-),score=19.51 TRINITY_DN2644_c0_g1_i4:437-1369(-)